jgi:glycosyltransferase involved in cell wall biosynthesis
MPCVSVVVPTFNRADMVGRALKSIFDQSFADTEVVVVDDGSTDGTEGVVRELAAAHGGFVRYVRQENQGCASARNAGIELASGELIAFLDSDDTWVPNAVEEMVTTLRATGADFVYSPAIEVFEDGSEYVNLPVAAGQPDGFALDHFMSCNVRNGTVLFRRDAIVEAGGYDETLRFNEDSDLLQRVSIRNRAAYVSTPTLRTLHHNGSKSRDSVGLHRALLTSAERILEENPQFAARLGEAGPARVNELKGLYVEALLAAGRAREARQAAATIAVAIEPALRCALLLGSPSPIRYVRRGKQLARRAAGGARGA